MLIDFDGGAALSGGTALTEPDPECLNRPWLDAESGATGDGDGDAVPDESDNCPSIYNPGQVNQDGDASGDVCDAFPTNPMYEVDSDEDGLPDSYEALIGRDPNVADPDAQTLDSDGDGAPDVFEIMQNTDALDPLDVPTAAPVPGVQRWSIGILLACLLAAGETWSRREASRIS